ncbi:hypothetical protein C0J52_18396 [Blattella germanica]|nr:hypothetical protein C0J52_18396 [Blattella germanica]
MIPRISTLCMVMINAVMVFGFLSNRHDLKETQMQANLQNLSKNRGGIPGMEEFGMFFVEILGQIVGLSWGAYNHMMQFMGLFTESWGRIVVFVMATLDDTVKLSGMESEDQFQTKVHRVIHNLYTARQNITAIRGVPGLEEIAIFFLEIIGSVVGLSWGTYVSIVYAINNINNNASVFLRNDTHLNV